MAQLARKIEKTLANIILMIGSVLLSIATLLVFGGVILRYCFSVSYPWMEEVCRYLITITAFTVVGTVIFRNGDIKLDFVVDMIKKHHKVMWVLHVINNIVTIVVAGMLLVWGFDTWIDAAGQRTISLLFPMRLPYALIPIGMVFLVTECVLKLIILFCEGPAYFDNQVSSGSLASE